MKIKSAQKGFSIVEVFVVIIIVGLLAAVGWLVMDRQNTAKNAAPSATTTDKETDSTKPAGERPASTESYASAISTNCQNINVDSKAAVAGEWQERLNGTTTIQKLQSVMKEGVGYQLIPGTLCDLDSGEKAISFSHVTFEWNTGGATETKNEKYTRGIFLYSDGNVEVYNYTGVKCVKTMPDPKAAVVITSVKDGIVHLKCPGNEPAEKFDLDLRSSELSKV